MDKYKAKQLEELLKGKEFLSYNIIELINNGKSAAVFLAKDHSDKNYAIKIFDDALVERFGHEIQEKRIAQETSLKGHIIPNLIKIIDGGKTSIGTDEYYFIIMEYIHGQNLKQYINTADYDNIFIQKVVEKLFRATEVLLTRGIVHRDIKPENIMIREDGEVVLMDLGVLKLIGLKSFSDQEEKQFVGTLQYAPPEFLTREEQDTPDGWKAVNLYQLGAVLHDLIMKKELFEHISPFANVVISIKEDAPNITNINLPFNTVQLARDLLIKDWQKRLTVCPNTRIEKFFTENPNNKTAIDKELEDISSLTSDNKAKFENLEKLQRSNKDKERKRLEISGSLDKIVKEILRDLQAQGLFLSLECSDIFYFDTDKELKIKLATSNILYKINGNVGQGFSRPLFLVVKTTNDENSFSKVEILGIFRSAFVKAGLENPNKMLREVGEEQNPRARGFSRPGDIIKFNFYTAFEGTAGFDKQFKESLILEFIKLIKCSLKNVKEEFAADLARNESIAKGERNSYTYDGWKSKMIFEIC